MRNTPELGRCLPFWRLPGEKRQIRGLTRRTPGWPVLLQLPGQWVRAKMARLDGRKTYLPAAGVEFDGVDAELSAAGAVLL